MLAKKYKGKVIVRNPLTKEIILYTKGADSAILSVLSKKYIGKVIVRNPLTKEIILYTKGADSAILSVLAKKYKGKENDTFLLSIHSFKGLYL